MGRRMGSPWREGVANVPPHMMRGVAAFGAGLYGARASARRARLMKECEWALYSKKGRGWGMQCIMWECKVKWTGWQLTRDMAGKGAAIHITRCLISFDMNLEVVSCLHSWGRWCCAPYMRHMPLIASRLYCGAASASA